MMENEQNAPHSAQPHQVDAARQALGDKLATLSQAGDAKARELGRKTKPALKVFAIAAGVTTAALIVWSIRQARKRTVRPLIVVHTGAAKPRSRLWQSAFLWAAQAMVSKMVHKHDEGSRLQGAPRSANDVNGAAMGASVAQGPHDTRGAQGE